MVDVSAWSRHDLKPHGLISMPVRLKLLCQSIQPDQQQHIATNTPSPTGGLGGDVELKVGERASDERGQATTSGAGQYGRRRATSEHPRQWVGGDDKWLGRQS